MAEWKLRTAFASKNMTTNSKTMANRKAKSRMRERMGRESRRINRKNS